MPEPQLTDFEYRENIKEILQVGRCFFILKHVHCQLFYLFVTMVVIVIINLYSNLRLANQIAVF